MKARFFNLLFKLYKTCLDTAILKKREKIFVYTDSRGYNVISKLGKTPFGTYIQRLCANYDITYSICPEKFTTIVDFISVFQEKEDWRKYDHVIMHCGVVDFSPRPLGNIQKVKDSKKGVPIFDKLFELNKGHHKDFLGARYYGEETITLYSKQYLEENVGVFLQQIDNLIWVDSNHFVPNWEGNFTKGRPANIDSVVSGYDDVLSKYIKNKVSIKDWTPDQIKKYTIDNIHFTPLGFEVIGSKIIEKIKELNGKD